MASITVIEGWKYALTLLRYFIEAVIPAIALYLFITPAILSVGGPEWIEFPLHALVGILVALAIVATLYKLVVDGTARGKQADFNPPNVSDTSSNHTVDPA